MRTFEKTAGFNTGKSYVIMALDWTGSSAVEKYREFTKVITRLYYFKFFVRTLNILVMHLYFTNCYDIKIPSFIPLQNDNIIWFMQQWNHISQIFLDRIYVMTQNTIMFNSRNENMVKKLLSKSIGQHFTKFVHGFLVWKCTFSWVEKITDDLL